MVAGAAVAVLAPTPAFAGSNPNTTYEYDCTSTLQAGAAAPFPVTANLTATPDPTFFNGGSFGAAGALSFTLAGGVIAGLASNNVLGTPGPGLTVAGLTIGSTDGTATGSYTYGHVFPQTAPTSSTLAGVGWGTTTTLTGAFTAAMVGDGVTSTTAGLPTGATIESVVPGVSATIQAATTAAATGATITLWSPMTFTDATVSTGNVFTAATTFNGHANVGLTTLTGGITINAALAVTFGTGGAGVGNNNCLETGWQNATTPGPSQNFETQPALPFGASTPLVLASGGHITQAGTTVAITPPPAAFVVGNDPPPVANDGTANMGIGQTQTITLSATDTDATPVTACNLVGTPSNARLTVTISNTPSVCQATLADTGTGPATVTFQFSASDVNGTGNTATETVNIGTPSVNEPLTQQVNPGQLVLSCNTPGSTGYPELLCPDFQFPAITLNGTSQTTTGPGNTLYVSDNRGNPAAGWSLVAQMVPTPSTLNTNAACAAAADFCNASVGAAAANPQGQIPPSDLSIGSIACTPAAGNTNPPAGCTAAAGGAFGGVVPIAAATAGESGGTWNITKTYTFNIPSSVYSGMYWGTVQYTVS
jgi:hypothetical protein